MFPREEAPATAVLPAGLFIHCFGSISMGADFAALTTNDITARHDRPAGLVPGPVRRLPVGAEAQPGGGVHFRCGRRASIGSRSRSTARRRSRCGKRAAAILGSGRRCRSRHALRLPRRHARQATARPGLALPAGRAARTVRDHRSCELPLDRPRLARPSARGDGRLRDACRQLHPGGKLGGGFARTAGTGRNRHHLYRGDAGRRFRRTLRLGL